MNITIDQAKAFDAIVRHGTFQKAAESLNKGHSAVMYLIKTLEEETQLTLLDRSGYRNRLTGHGEVVLRHCQQILVTKDELDQICQKLKGGWEPSLKLVYDGVIDFNRICEAILKLNDSQIPTKIKILAAYLREVETAFMEEKADMMLTILPIEEMNIPFIKLQPLRMFLVAHEDHALAKSRNGRMSVSVLNNHTYISVRGASVQLGLATERLEFSSSFLVNDFYMKKQAILKRLGYGWLPEYLIRKELADRSIRVLQTGIINKHTFHPRLYHRGTDTIGNTAEQLLEHFKTC